MHYLRCFAVMVIFAIAFVENNIDAAVQAHPELHASDVRDLVFQFGCEKTKLER